MAQRIDYEKLTRGRLPPEKEYRPPQKLPTAKQLALIARLHDELNIRGPSVPDTRGKANAQITRLLTIKRRRGRPQHSTLDVDLDQRLERD